MLDPYEYSRHQNFSTRNGRARQPVLYQMLNLAWRKRLRTFLQKPGPNSWRLARMLWMGSTFLIQPHSEVYAWTRSWA